LESKSTKSSEMTNDVADVKNSSHNVQSRVIDISEIADRLSCVT
jgi:hypothetical protein